MSVAEGARLEPQLQKIWINRRHFSQRLQLIDDILAEGKFARLVVVEILDGEKSGPVEILVLFMKKFLNIFIDALGALPPILVIL